MDELLHERAPIEVVGLSFDEMDQILIGEEADTVDRGHSNPSRTQSQSLAWATSLILDLIG